MQWKWLLVLWQWLLVALFPQPVRDFYFAVMKGLLSQPQGLKVTGSLALLDYLNFRLGQARLGQQTLPERHPRGLDSCVHGTFLHLLLLPQLGLPQQRKLHAPKCLRQVPLQHLRRRHVSLGSCAPGTSRQ